MTDPELKQLLAKMLPETLIYYPYVIDGDWEQEPFLSWKDDTFGNEVLDTELLHICWLVEEGLDRIQQVCYQSQLNHKGTVGDFSYHATWQQRTLALAKVKGLV